jgi:hypothetical protein
MSFKVIVQLLIGVIGFGVWTFVVFYVKPEMLDAYMGFVVSVVSGVIGHAIRDVLPSKEEPRQEEVTQ